MSCTQSPHVITLNPGKTLILSSIFSCHIQSDLQVTFVSVPIKTTNDTQDACKISLKNEPIHHEADFFLHFIA